MLGKPFFSLCQALQDARSFEEVSDLISNRLPALVGADDTHIMVCSYEHGVQSIHGHGPIAGRMRERMDDLNRLGADHPLTKFVDFSEPASLGFAVSDHIAPDVYRQSEFNQVLKGPELASEDSLFGRVISSPTRFCMLIACRGKGVYTETQREIFDAILFIARAVLDRIAGGNVEAQVTKFLLTARAEHPNAFFVVRNEIEVLPINTDAVAFSETYWGEDEAVRILAPDITEALNRSLDVSWKDPLISSFTEVEIDLGRGESKAYAMYKPDGDILIVLPITGEAEAAAERLAAVLTRRQREIMDWIAEGKTSAEVAIILDISPRTVEKHLEAVFQRLGVENRIAAVRRYMDLKAGMPV